jgi:hypothetical protein
VAGTEHARRAAVIAALLAAGCGGAREVRLEVEVDDSAASVSYRVWDERHQLVRDQVLSASEFPRVLRLFPDGGDPTPIEHRWARVEVEIWSASGCPYGRAIGTYRYEEHGRDEVLAVEASPSQSQDCTVLYVDGSAGGGDECTESAPCRTIGDAIERGNSIADRVIVLVAGGADYPRFGLRESFSNRSLGNPNVVRAWPGRSLPLPRVSGGQAAIDVCCASQPGLNDPASGVEIDGFEVSGGERTGVELNGADQVRLRNCYVHDNGFEDQNVERGGIRVITAVDVEVEHNLVTENRHPGGLAPVTGIVVGYTYDGRTAATITENRLVANQDAGLRVYDLDATVRMFGNTMCGNDRRGLWIEPNEGSAGAGTIDVAENALFGNGSEGLELEWSGPVRVVANTFGDDAAGSYTLHGPGRPTLDRNIVYRGTGEFVGENLVEPPFRLANVDCLLAPPDATAGTCADFPSCPSPL